MVTLSRIICRASSLASIPRQLLQHQKPPPPPQLSRPDFIPFSQFQEQRRLLESHLVSALDVCSNLLQIKQLHAQIILKGLDQCCYVLTKLVRSLTKVNIPVDPYARSVFNQVRNPNPFLYTAIIRGYLMEGLLEESVDLYNLMRSGGVGPVSFTFTALFKSCGAVRDVDLGRQIHAQTIFLGGFDSDLYVKNTMIDMYVECGFLGCARRVFDEMPVRDVISWTELIVAYARSGDMESASKLFDESPAKDMVAWTAMVTGFAQNAKPREAIEYFEKMQDIGIGTDGVTIIGAISACAQLGAPKYAHWLRDVAEKSGFGACGDVVMGSAMIDMFSKCGNIEEAYKVFQGMKERNVFTYSSMIMGFAMQGRAHEAMKLFDEMVNTETKPNNITFIWILTACAHAGLIEQGWHIFNAMEKCHGVEPSVEHYTCMVDLLGRGGKLEEALKLVNSMPMKPNGGVWGALLGACRIYGDPDVAEVAASHLFELEPDNIGNYVLLSNIYASAGRWPDASRVRKLMRTKGLRKNPGRSWLEAKKGVIHEFFAGDLTHPKSVEIRQALEDLLHRLKTKGYQPNLNSVPYDMSDVEKKRILITHSEKLALAFGVISLDPGSTIRIMKNLRICEDCHTVMCGASEIMSREIVVRDKLRFHHFRNGKCSCNNFW